MNQSFLLTVVVIGGLFYLGGQYVASLPERAGEQIKAQQEFTVQGHGKASGVPDTAIVSLGVVTEPAPTSEAATSEMAEKINRVISALRAAGTAEEDIKTANLSIQPQYDFNSGRQSLVGYVAQQTLEVKIRSAERLGEITATAAREGANQTGGVQYESADEESLRLEAQKNAIADARQKAEALAHSLGVKLGQVKQFDLSGAAIPDKPVFLEAQGRGGDVPVTPPGTQETEATVTVTYTFE